MQYFSIKRFLSILTLSTAICSCQSCACPPFCISTQQQIHVEKTIRLYNLTGAAIILNESAPCNYYKCCPWEPSLSIPIGRFADVVCGPGQVRSFAYSTNGMMCSAGMKSFNVSGYSTQNTRVNLY